MKIYHQHDPPQEAMHCKRRRMEVLQPLDLVEKDQIVDDQRHGGGPLVATNP